MFIEAVTVVQRLALLPHNTEVPPGACKQHSHAALLGSHCLYLVPNKAAGEFVQYVDCSEAKCVQDAFLQNLVVTSGCLISCCLSMLPNQSDPRPLTSTSHFASHDCLSPDIFTGYFFFSLGKLRYDAVVVRNVRTCSSNNRVQNPFDPPLVPHPAAALNLSRSTLPRT